jgi:hypothetical protein
MVVMLAPIIKDENLKRLGRFIAEELIDLAKETDSVEREVEFIA